MASHNVLVNKNHVHVGGYEHKTGDVVKVTADERQALTDAGAFAGGSPTLTDQGEVGDATAPTALIAMTSAVAVGGTPTKAEYDALRQDAINTRTYVTGLKTALTGEGLPF